MHLFRFLAIVGAILSPCLSSVVQGSSLDSITEKLERPVEDGGFTGYMSIQFDNIVLDRGYGRAYHGEEGVPTEFHQFKIGSITKNFTAVAIYDLFQQYNLSYDSSIDEYLPQLRDRIGLDSFKTVTVRQLLEHKSGLSDVKRFAYHYGREVSFKYFLFLLRFFEVDHSEGYKYNNLNYYLLGQIIQNLTGVSYSDFLNTKYF